MSSITFLAKGNIEGREECQYYKVDIATMKSLHIILDMCNEYDLSFPDLVSKLIDELPVQPEKEDR